MQDSHSLAGISYYFRIAEILNCSVDILLRNEYQIIDKENDKTDCRLENTLNKMDSKTKERLLKIAGILLE